MNDPQSPIPSPEMLAAFPPVDPGAVPCGSRLLVQLRSPKTMSAGGIILHAETVETEQWNTQIAKVIAVGPLAFKHRDTQIEWKEGAWCKPGDFIRFNKYIGDRFEVPIDGDNKGLFVIINDLEVTARVTGDPLSVRAWIV